MLGDLSRFFLTVNTSSLYRFPLVPILLRNLLSVNLVFGCKLFLFDILFTFGAWCSLRWQWSGPEKINQKYLYFFPGGKRTVGLGLGRHSLFSSDTAYLVFSGLCFFTFVIFHKHISGFLWKVLQIMPDG